MTLFLIFKTKKQTHSACSHDIGTIRCLFPLLLYRIQSQKNRLVFLVDARIIELLWRMDVSLNEQPKG